MRNGATVTKWAGRSSSRPSSWPIRNRPPGIATRSSGRIFENRELEFAFVAVHAIEHYAQFVADGKLAARALAHDLADVLLISVLITGQRVDGHEAFDE